MATYRDYAIQEYQARLADEQAEEQAREDALVAAAKEAARPLFTDATGKVVLDPVGKTTADLVDEDAGLVVLTTTDGSNVSFGIYPNREPVERYLVTLNAGEWQRGAEVGDLDDVGEALTEEEAV